MNSVSVDWKSSGAFDTCQNFCLYADGIKLVYRILITAQDRIRIEALSIPEGEAQSLDHGHLRSAAAGGISIKKKRISTYRSVCRLEPC
jgi:hypothetical protein